MFGLKIMKKESYNYLVESQNKVEAKLNTINANLNQIEAHNLCLKNLLKEANKINKAKANENGCMIGEWCSNCDYGKRMKDTNCWFDPTMKTMFGNYKYISADAGYYCMKHLADICPEFQNNKN